MSLGKHVAHLHAEVDWLSTGHGRHLGHPFKILLVPTRAVEVLATALPFKPVPSTSHCFALRPFWFCSMEISETGSAYLSWKCRPCMRPISAAGGQVPLIHASLLSPWIEGLSHIHEDLQMVLVGSNTSCPQSFQWHFLTLTFFLSFPVSLSLPCTWASWGHIQK